MFLLKGVAVIFVQAFVWVVWVVFFVRVFDVVVVVVVVVVVAVGVMVLVVVVVAVLWLEVVGCCLAVGGWRLAVGGWWLVIGDWWLVVGGWWRCCWLLAASFVAAAVGLMRHCSVFGPPCYTSCWYCWCSCDC